MTQGSGPGSSRPRLSNAERLEGLCMRSVREAGVDGAGVSMLLANGTPNPVFASDDLSALVEDLQFTLGVGPCFDAASIRSPVLVSDLADPGEGLVSRWPAFLEEAVKAGVRAVFAFPLGMGSISLGTLDLYRRSPGDLSSDQLGRTLEVADAIGLALLDDGVPPSEDLDHVHHRATVHQAAGMAMIQLDVSIEEALLVLRSTAYAEGISINELATALVDGRRRLTKEQS